MKFHEESDSDVKTCEFEVFFFAEISISNFRFSIFYLFVISRSHFLDFLLIIVYFFPRFLHRNINITRYAVTTKDGDTTRVGFKEEVDDGFDRSASRRRTRSTTKTRQKRSEIMLA